MNDRARAHEILRQAREILTQRLTERVIDSAEEILADASGDSYMGDIEAIYDQIGMRLTHISQMLSNLPPPQETTTHHTGVHTGHEDDTFTVMTETSPSADAVVSDTTHAIAGPVYVASPALPAPKLAELPEGPATDSDPVSFGLFISQVRENNLTGAGLTLSSLLEIDDYRGLQCAVHFAERLERDPQFPHKAGQLRTELQSGGSNGVLMLLYECFGLTGVESLGALQALRRLVGE